MPKQISQESRYKEVIKKSRFLGFSYPVNSIEQARNIISKYEEEYKKASHVCWAFRVMNENGIAEYNSDAGEPNSSAGPPIQSAIEGCGLVNTLCIIVRYFGGIKLGIGGLIRAYGRAAGKTLDQSGTKQIVQYITLKFRVSHLNLAKAMQILHLHQLKFEQNYDSQGVTFTIKLPKEKSGSIKSEINAIPEIELLED